MTGVALFGVPLVLVYQGWSYWVFRKRISTANIPDAHAIVPQIGDGQYADNPGDGFPLDDPLTRPAPPFRPPGRSLEGVYR